MQAHLQGFPDTGTHAHDIQGKLFQKTTIFLSKGVDPSFLWLYQPNGPCAFNSHNTTQQGHLTYPPAVASQHPVTMQVNCAQQTYTGPHTSRSIWVSLFKSHYQSCEKRQHTMTVCDSARLLAAAQAVADVEPSCLTPTLPTQRHQRPAA